MSYQQPHKTICLTHLKCFLEAQFSSTSLVVMDGHDRHKKCIYVCHIIFSRLANQRNKIFVHVSYPCHAYLESRLKIKDSYCWMFHGKSFCNIFVTDVHREQIPSFFHLKKLNKKLLIDFLIPNLFLYLILVA